MWTNACQMILLASSLSAGLPGSVPALDLVEGPTEGEVWPVGAWRDLGWTGATGPVDVLLSVDGGLGFDILVADWSGSGRRLQVPDRPSKDARIRIIQDEPPAMATSPPFAIDASVILTSIEVRPGPVGEGSFSLRWDTIPAVFDLRGYRVEARAPGAPWTTIAAQLRTTTLLATALSPRSWFRLWAVNGLGTEVFLGEAAVAPRPGVDVWPSPYRGGPMTIRVRAERAPSEAMVVDAGGRSVARVTGVRGGYGHHLLIWDGRDAQGDLVPSGVYQVVAVADTGPVGTPVVIVR